MKCRSEHQTFCFSGEGSGDETMYNSRSGRNEAMVFASDKSAGQELESSGIYNTTIINTTDTDTNILTISILVALNLSSCW